jgi:hypothetical protein
VLGTLSSRVEPDAERLAVESAIEAGVPLLVVNVLPLPACPRALVLSGPSAVTRPEAQPRAALALPAGRARGQAARACLVWIAGD